MEFEHDGVAYETQPDIDGSCEGCALEAAGDDGEHCRAVNNAFAVAAPRNQRCGAGHIYLRRMPAVEVTYLEPTKPDGIGDVTSDQPGTAARYNAGKAPFELIPLRALADFYQDVPIPVADEVLAAVSALGCLSEWQQGGDAAWLVRSLHALGDGWVECAEVFEYGRRKYAAWNWAKGFDWSVPLACATRHLLAIIRGEAIDPESGKTHRGHVYCNVVMLQTFVRTYPQGDDRTPFLRGAA